MGKLFYAVEAVGGHLIGGYEYGLRLPLTPLIETLIVEAFCLVIYVCVLVWDVAIYHAVFGYADLFVVKHRRRDRQILPPPNIWAGCAAVLGIASDATVFRPSLCCSSLGRLCIFFFLNCDTRLIHSKCCNSEGRLTFPLIPIVASRFCPPILQIGVET